ncbi:MAG TPA: Sec-independent protein translocase protein TatB [Desulfobacterales bacterium]|nr:Sec-independent protein translocase protein TatB [Desulfobacterales bacterium]
MFGIGMPELILIAVVALIVLGPKKLPDLAKSMGRAVREFKKATSELKETLQVDSEFSEVKKAFTEFESDVNKTIQTGAGGADTPAVSAPAAAGAVSAAPAIAASETAPEPKAAEKLDELKKAFDTWNAGPAPSLPEAPAATPSPAAEPASTPDKPKSA